ncbi:hypothetical protein ONE63_000802 [Megalurothrips usitatus]|uniref:Proteasome assembly chaperone 1 n=1 Tax=Megalurothrips usitatus TaxID=439358 RepID=A0AAV7XZL3_9NEOP|nr:hypothetical protein ONE63_000802 [Megalurothrips usitatus]
MALFGEIVEPVSRALYIDESSDEEDSQDLSTTKIPDIKWVDEAPTSIETLLVFHGHLATDFLLKVLEGSNSKSAAHLKEKILYHGKRSLKELNIFLYNIGHGIFGCLCPAVDIANSNEVVEKLLPVLNITKRVVAIATIPAPFFKGNDPTLDLPPAFMRMLYTSTFDTKDVIAPLLETPNMVTGVPASILNWCEVFKKPGCLYVCYSDSDHLDSISGEPLVKIFSNVFEGLLESKILSFNSVGHESNSSLYM